MAFPKKTGNEPDKKQVKLMLSEEADNDLILLSRRLVLSKSETIELLLKNAKVSYTELANIKFLESREEVFKKLINDMHEIRKDIDLLKEVNMP